MTFSSHRESSPVQDKDVVIRLRQYLSLFLQWWWIIVLAALVAGGAGFYFTFQIKPLYRASTTLLINEAPANRAADYSTMITSERIAHTYAQMMLKRPILEEVIQRLELGLSPADLQEMVVVSPVRDTQLMTITVDSYDSSLSPAVANMLVVIFREQLHATQSARFAASKESLQKQMADAEKQIAETMGEIKATNDPEENNRLQTRRNQYEQIYANLFLSYEQIRASEAQSVSNVEQIESAIPNPDPVNKNLLQNMLLSSTVGIMFAIGTIFTIDLLDDTVNSPSDIQHKLQLPVIGTIPHFEEPEEGWLITEALPRSPITESFRALRMNVQHAASDGQLRTLIVTSPTPSDGKTTITSNLAVVMSKTGKRITVLDADMHRPQMHSRFKTAPQPGLGNLFFDPLMQLNGSFQKTAIDSLYMVSVGNPIPNPSEMLGSKKMIDIINLILEKSDMVIIDTPPILSVTDALALASIVDGVLLVVKPGVTKISMLQTMLEQLHFVGAKVIGVVVNGVDHRNARYGYYYKNYQYKAGKTNNPNTPKRKSGWGQKVEKTSNPNN
jgi:capsular exopolysaccharide synthesis family protein